MSPETWDVFFCLGRTSTKECPTLWQQHRQQQKNPRKKISRWHGRTSQKRWEWGADCLFHPWKTQVYLSLDILHLIHVFCWWKSSHWMFVHYFPVETTLGSVDNIRAWILSKVCSVDTCGLQPSFIRKSSQNGLNQSGFWLQLES